MANVLLRAPEKGEARVAFRIYTIDPAERKYPKIDTREVVHCDGAMWWQVGLDFNGQDVRHKPKIDEDISEEELLRILETGTDDVLGTGIDYALKFGQLARREQLNLIVREWKRNDLETALSLVQRRVDHLMIWNGKAYGRGGEPTYVQHPLAGLHHYSDDGVANIGADRSVEPRHKGLGLDVGRFEFGQAAFMCGTFQRADEYDAALSKRSITKRSSSEEFDRIEVLMPDALKLNRGEVRLDAIFRATSRALSHRDEFRWADLRDLFAETSARDFASPTASRTRFETMLQFVRLASNESLLPAELNEAYQCFLRLEKSPELSDLGPLLAEEDGDALAAMGPGTS